MFDEKKQIPIVSSQNVLGNNKYFDPKMGTAGALVMGGIVYYINSEYGFDAASIAATKQAAYTFIAGGSILRISENLSTYFKNRMLAITASVLIPSALTIGLTYSVHMMKGTPEPFESTVPTMLIAPPAFIWWGRKKRNQLEQMIEKNND